VDANGTETVQFREAEPEIDMTDNWRHQPPPLSVSPKARRDVGMIVFAAVMIFLLLALVAFFVWAWRQVDARYVEFMTGCEQDHKHYKCMLLAGQPAR
jgi:hypothetical protein